MENDSVKEAKNSSNETLLSPRPAQVYRPIYVGRLRCGCAVAATIDADDVAEMARNGYLIETVEAAAVQIAGCQCDNKPANQKGTSPLR